MKVAIPVFSERISPVFDWCRELLLVDVASGREDDRRHLTLEALDPLQRVEQLAEQRVELLVCGGISELLLSSIEARGIRVVPWVAGSIEEVLADLLTRGLPGPRLVMPGCRRAGGPGCGLGRMGKGGKGRGGPGGLFGGKGPGRGKGGKSGKGRGRGWKRRPT